MSGKDVPYQLRPNKFIDRQIFIDLLSRLVPIKGVDKYVYISMGGKHLTDHSAVYRLVGITKLFSFDKDAEIVARQNVNKPISDAKCEQLDSCTLASRIDGILESFCDATNVIIWLDYDDPNKRLTQLQELIEISKGLQDGDIVRITLNAHLGTLNKSGENSKWHSEGYGRPGEYYIEKLKDQLGDFVPVDIKSIEENDFPSILCRCIGMAISKVESGKTDIRFIPLLNTTYRDGQQMVTVTCLVERKEGGGDINSNLKAWKFKPESWSDVTLIAAPDLSIREKLKLDEHIADEPKEIAKKIGFKFRSEENSLEQIKSYQLLHRYYPSFHHVHT